MTIIQALLVRSRVGDNRSNASASQAVIRPVALFRQNIPSLVQWTFLIFVFSLPFETLDLGFQGELSLARITGLLFFGSYILHYNSLFNSRSFAPAPRPVWWFLGYVTIYAINGFFIPEDSVHEFVIRFVTLLQLIVLFWIASSVLEEEKLARTVLLTYAIATSILAIGVIVDLPGFSSPMQVTTADARETGLGWNANAFGSLMALAALIPIGLFLNSRMGKIRGSLLLCCMLPLLVMMVKTGSRAAVGAFMIGCAVYALPFLRQKRKLTAIGLSIAGIAALGYMVAKNPDFLERWQLASEGKLATREDLIPATIQMIFERPLFGWQPVQFVYELGARVNAPSGQRDTHNLFLWVLSEVGLIGAIPFLVGLSLCARAAWRARTDHLGLLPISLLGAILAANMTHTYLVEKAHWFVLALAIAAESRVKRQEKLWVQYWERGGRGALSAKSVDRNEATLTRG